MPDFPDFQKPVWNRRDTTPRELISKIYAFEAVGALGAGQTTSQDIYTVPSGKIFYLADLGFGTHIRAVGVYRIKNGSNLWSAILDWYDTRPISFTIPPTLDAGETLQLYVENWDLIGGKYAGYAYGWEEPASHPAKPNSDDPEERYKLGDFNKAQIYFLPEDETLILFQKFREGKMNYLKFKSYGGPKQKKLASLHLKPKVVSEILDIIHTSPQNVKEVLEKLEKKYKPKISNFSH